MPDLKVTEGTLRFEDVRFTYPGATHPTLDGVSFEARAGQTIGIVGAPGSGKSTLAHLIPRFYDVSGGRITIDGQDVSEVTLQSLRRSVAVVQQDTFLFTTTIENNIAYGDPWSKETKIEKAAESAQLHNYIMGLPAGYDTVVGERGVSLSGGQRQRLSIARSLVLKPAVMVFDDSTAAIDAGTEHRIRSAIRRYASDRVTLVISHRLSSLLHADTILFLEDGKIVEQGSHDELLAKGGRYRALYDLQTRPDRRPRHRERRRNERHRRRRTRSRRLPGPAPAARQRRQSHRIEEEIFGKAYDPRTVRRIWAFVQPYRTQDLSVGRRRAGVHRAPSSPSR